MTLKIRSITVPTYSCCVMLLGKYSRRCRNLWSIKYDLIVSSSIGCYKVHWNISIYNVLSKEKTSNRKFIFRRKNNNSAKLYDCRIYWTSEVWTPMFRNFHHCLRLLHSSYASADQCFHTLLRYIGKSLSPLALICCNGNAWSNNFLKKSRCNHNQNNILIDIKISLF